MPKDTTENSSSASTEGPIRRVSADPLLDAEGLMGLGDEYSPNKESTRSVQNEMGHQAVFDEDDLGSPNTITSR